MSGPAIEPGPDASRRPRGRGGPGSAWRAVAILGAVVAACWVVPRLRGHGLYGHGLFKLIHVYVGLFSILAWLASLAIAAAPARYRRPLALRLMAVLGALVVGLPLADLAATVWSVRFGHLWYYSLSFPRRENAPDPELVWKRRPGLTWHGRKTPDCGEVAYRTDEQGFRNPPGIHRADLVVVGDSVTEAGEVPEASTFVRRAGDALGLEAVNLGTSGYGPQQELVVLRRYGLAYRPRLVVWQVTEWNDIQDAEMYRMRDEPPARTLPPWSVLYERHSPVMHLATLLLPGRRPLAVRFVRSDGRVEEQAFWPYQPDLHRQHPQGLAALEDSIATAAGLCRSRGVEFVVLYVPSHVRVLLPYLRFKNDARRDRICPGGVVDRPDDLAHALAALCDRLGCPMIDLCPPLRRRAAVENQRLYVPNDPHLGPDGHDEAQKALVRFVEARRVALGLEPRPRTEPAPLRK